MRRGSVLIIGFLGGFEQWDDEHRSVRKVALDLRARGIFAETVSNHRRATALEFIRRALDSNSDGRIDADEARAARVILYGQSWGGAAVIKIARDLERLGVPVLLTVQVDSVGPHDGTIPSNVRAAANFYQHDLRSIHGRTKLRAENRAATRILGNWEFDYTRRPVDLSEASWARRKFGGSHAKMELDPQVWTRVERLISEAIAQ